MGTFVSRSSSVEGGGNIGREQSIVVSSASFVYDCKTGQGKSRILKPDNCRKGRGREDDV